MKLFEDGWSENVPEDLARQCMDRCDIDWRAWPTPQQLQDAHVLAQEWFVRRGWVGKRSEAENYKAPHWGWDGLFWQWVTIFYVALDLYEMENLKPVSALGVWPDEILDDEVLDIDRAQSIVIAKELLDLKESE